MDTWVVLVHLGCCKELPQTGLLIKNKSLFLTVLEVQRPRSEGQQGLVPVKVLFCIAEGWLLILVEGAEDLCVEITH